MSRPTSPACRPSSIRSRAISRATSKPSGVSWRTTKARSMRAFSFCAGGDAGSAERRLTFLLAVVRVAATAVVGGVSHCGDLRHPLPQRLLHAVLERDIHRGATVAAATELKHHHAFGIHLQQGHAAAV